MRHHPSDVDPVPKVFAPKLPDSPDDTLFAVAAALPRPYPGALVIFQDQAHTLAEELTRRLLARPDLEERLIGPGNTTMMADNHLNHFRFLSAHLAHPDASELVSTARWAIRSYMAHGFFPEYWRVMLPLAATLLEERLDTHVAGAVLPYYRFLADNLDSLLPVGLFPPVPGDRSDLALPPIARRYMELLLAGDRHTASSLILGQAASGMPVRDIYLQVLSPAQQALGQLWQEGSISVALEHFATAATQMIMGQLFPYIIGDGHAQRRNGAGFVGCCVAGELHEIGMRMVCDLLEMEGFDTWYLGANTPDTAIIDFLADKLQESAHRPLVLGVSVTLVQGVPLARNLIVSMRKDPRLDGVRVLVGGLPFLNRPNLWSEVGADGHAADASEATRTLTQLTRISTEGLL